MDEDSKGKHKLVLRFMPLSASRAESMVLKNLFYKIIGELREKFPVEFINAQSHTSNVGV